MIKSQSKLPTIKSGKKDLQEVPTSHEHKKFILDSGDYFIARVLREHGWQQVASNSKDYHLKWVAVFKSSGLEQTNDQWINHFRDSYSLTTKLGLYKVISAPTNALITEAGKNYLQYFPRSYDLSSEKECFIQDYQHTAVINLMKKFMIHIEICAPELYDEMVANPVHTPLSLSTLVRGRKIFIQEDSKSFKDKSPKVNGKVFLHTLVYLVKFQNKTQLEENFLTSQQIEELIQYSREDPPYEDLERHFSQRVDLECYPTKQSLDLFFKLYKHYMSDSPWSMSDGLDNIWIIKTSQSSRGRSLFLVKSIEEAIFYDNGNRLIQKYIENVWIYNEVNLKLEENYPFLEKLYRKKFDIRIWVLVRSFDPLVAEIYQEGYLRISSEKYHLNQIKDKKKHLTNLAIGWKNHLDDSYVLLSDFTRFLEEQKLLPAKKLFGQIKENIRYHLECADAYIKKDFSLNCFQLFGFDILLDGNLKPWLLECNMSPTCKERGQLKQIAYQMATGLLSKVGLIEGESSRWRTLVDYENTNCALKKSIRVRNSKKEKCLKPINHSKISNVSAKNVLSQADNNCMMSTLSVFPQNCKNSTKEMLKIEGVKINPQKYMIYERYQNTMEKIVVIQRKVRKWLQKIDKPARCQKKIGQSLLLIEKLAKIMKKEKLRYFRRLKRQISKLKIVSKSSIQRAQ